MSDIDPLLEARASAKEAGLRYFTDSAPGFARRRVGAKSFAYLDTSGKRVRDARVLERFRALVIPPAWENVWICPSEKGHLQVTGRDARGRKQYRYHPDWSDARNENKFSRMLIFARALPRIRARVRRDVRLEGMGRERVLGAVVSLMDQTLVRIGNDEYAEKNQSYGLTTIRNHHARVKGSRILLRFKGKSGKMHELDIEDPHVAPIIRRCQELPGQELFTYLNEEDRAVDVSSGDVNDYLREISGEEITAKDFRTWGGTVEAARFLKTQETPPTKAALKKLFAKTVSHTAERLRNTNAVCRKYYIHPCVFEAFESGELVKIAVSCRKSARARVRGLSTDERFAVALLKSALQ